MIKKMGTAWRVLLERGPAAVGGIARDKLIQLSRRSPGGFARLEGCLFRLDDLQESAREPLLMDLYEKDEREAVRRFLDPALPVIELGGSIGVVSCVINKKLARPERHVVVEADPGIVPKLAANRERNGCKFEILNRALAYDNDEVVFNKGADSLTGGVHVKGAEQVTVKTVTLEKLARERSFDRFTLVCDIEGSEIELVEREKDVLAVAADTVILETHPGVRGVERASEMLRVLAARGFETEHANRDVYVLKNRRRNASLGVSAG